MPGIPKKVGKSGDMVWVRSTTDLNWRGAASLAVGATALAAKPAAAPLKNRRRVSAYRTISWHPGTHMMDLLRRAAWRLAWPWWRRGATAQGDCATDNHRPKGAPCC